MATKKQILNQINVIEKKLPNGEVKDINDTMIQYKKQTQEHEKKMLLMKKDIRLLRNKLSNY